MVFCLSSTGVTWRPVGAAVDSGDLTLTAQNFHIYTSGNLRFVFGIKSDALVKELTADSTAFFRVTLGQRITTGEKQVQEIYAKPELFSAIDTVDLSLREVTRRADGQFEVIALSTDIPSGTRRIEFDGPGIYPVRVEIVVGTTTRATLTTFVNRFDPSREAKPMPVNIVAALDTPITLRPDGSRRIDLATRTKIEKIISLLKLNQ